MKAKVFMLVMIGGAILTAGSQDQPVSIQNVKLLEEVIKNTTDEKINSPERGHHGHGGGGWERGGGGGWRGGWERGGGGWRGRWERGGGGWRGGWERGRWGR